MPRSLFACFWWWWQTIWATWIAIEGTTLASIFLVTFYGRPNSLEAGVELKCHDW